MKPWNSTKRIWLISIVLLLLVLPAALSAQYDDVQQFMDDPGASCTSIMVGRKATTDGSVITCHSCDGPYRTWLNIVPSADHPKGAKDKVYWGTMHTETAWDLRGKREMGEIPQVHHTYAYLNTCYPCLNEKQLAIGETTFGGKREMRNDDGLFMIEELQRIVLERCTTAREAIRLIGDLVKEYGYADGGECLTIADPDEVWHFEILGAGLMEIGAVWAAVRIPDDHVGVSANIPRIGTLDLDDPDNYMASENVMSLAEDMEFWSPDSGEFKFWKAYGRRDKPFSIREYYILSRMAPSLNLQYDADELPFSVKPDKKVSVREVMQFYRETYEGSEFDMTKNLLVEKRRWGRRQSGDDQQEPELEKSPIANPYMSRDMRTLINTLKPGTIEPQRTIAIAGCSYSQVIQCRGWLPPEIGGIAWFSFDNPGESPRIPIFAGTLSLPKSFEIGGQHRYRTDAAIWQFRRANRLATVRWGATQPYIEGAVQEMEERAFTELPLIEKRALELYKRWEKEQKGKDESETKRRDREAPEYRKFLTQYTNDFARAAMNRWWELGDQFWGMFRMGF